MKENEMGRAGSMNGEAEECICDVGGKARKEEPLEGPRLGWADNIRRNLGVIVGWYALDWSCSG
jgi:hypothetical protein